MPTKREAFQNEVDKLAASHRGKRSRPPVAKIIRMGVPDGSLIDPGSLITPIVVGVEDARGGKVLDELIMFEVIDPSGTGTGFVVEGIDFPVSHSFGVSFDGGGYALALPVDTLRAGKGAGAVTLRVSAPQSAGRDVHVDYHLKITLDVVHKISPVEGGDEAHPVDSLRPVTVVAEVLDDHGSPITYGHLRYSMYDPNDTGALMLWGGLPVSWVQMEVDKQGRAQLDAVLLFGTRPGKFFIRASRAGREPHHDFLFTAK